MVRSIQNQEARLRAAVRRFLRQVEEVSDEAFLSPLTRSSTWSPRDVVAHLIGWNRHVVVGAGQIARGELPFYDVDPGTDYAKVNAELVRRHPSRDRKALARELSESAGELASFLLTLDDAVWSGDHGVRHGGSIVTIEGTVDELVADYDHHRAQLEELVQATGRGKGSN